MSYDQEVIVKIIGYSVVLLAPIAMFVLALVVSKEFWYKSKKSKD